MQPSIHTKLVDDDSKHSLPIGQMGNYQDYLKKMPVPLREIESTPVRQHMFGKETCILLILRFLNSFFKFTSKSFLR